MNKKKKNKECSHPTCGETCRRPKKVKKIYKLRPYSLKRQAINREYSKISKEFVADNPFCKIRSPVCTGRTQGIHHPKGRSTIKLLLDPTNRIPACNPCNGWCESATGEAKAMGFKKSKYK